MHNNNVIGAINSNRPYGSLNPNLMTGDYPNVKPVLQCACGSQIMQSWQTLNETVYLCTTFHDWMIMTTTCYFDRRLQYCLQSDYAISPATLFNKIIIYLHPNFLDRPIQFVNGAGQAAEYYGSADVINNRTIQYAFWLTALFYSRT